MVCYKIIVNKCFKPLGHSYCSETCVLQNVMSKNKQLSHTGFICTGWVIWQKKKDKWVTNYIQCFENDLTCRCFCPQPNPAKRYFSFDDRSKAAISWPNCPMKLSFSTQSFKLLHMSCGIEHLLLVMEYEYHNFLFQFRLLAENFLYTLAV